MLEPIIRHSIFEIATPLIKDEVERMVREQADTVKDLLPDAVRKYLQSKEENVREQLKEGIAAQTERLAADVIRAVAEEQIQTTVQQVTPSMVEEQIKAEIRRLDRSRLAQSALSLLTPLASTPCFRQRLHSIDVLAVLLSRLAILVPSRGHNVSSQK